MAEGGDHAVTGAFGYSGRHIAGALLDAGCTVRTLTNSPRRRHDFGHRVAVRPLAFDDPVALAEGLAGCRVLYNTYWIRFNHGEARIAQAVQNTRRLFAAAQRAGVQRVVHLSVTKPDEGDHLEYYRAKAVVERMLVESGLAYTILRPSLLFGGADVLVNNIAWAIRRMPVILVFGDGRYRLQPLHVDELAALAVAQGREPRAPSAVVDAVGPMTVEYRELLEIIMRAVGRPRRMVGVPPRVAWCGTWILGRLLGDVMLTWPEVSGLMEEKLATDSPGVGRIRIDVWAREHGATLGLHYAHELRRRRDRLRAYDQAG